MSIKLRFKGSVSLQRQQQTGLISEQTGLHFRVCAVVKHVHRYDVVKYWYSVVCAWYKGQDEVETLARLKISGISKQRGQ